MDLFKNLNDNQKEAVKAVSGPVIVIAGAGSGKTRVLTHRLAYLVEQGIDSKNILAVTFTNKAAKEMKERVEKLVGAECESTILTFHSLCARILRRNAHLLGYKQSFEIYDEEDSLKTVKKAFEDLFYENTRYKPKDFRNLISLRKNGKSIFLEERMQRDFELCYEKYNAKLKAENAMDFDDLLLNTVYLLNNFPDVLDFYQRLFLYIMVDEFQDTNVIQYELIQLLGARFSNVFVVGDGDQSIYSFRNANVGNIKDFINHFKPKQIILDTNYRSTQSILNAANSLIDKNADRIKKNLVSVNDEGDKITLKENDNFNDELIYVKNTIEEMHKKGYSYGDMAVFYRINALSRNFEDVLMKNNIPYKVFGGLSFFSRKEIKDIIGYLKLVLDKENIWAFKRVVNEPKRGIGTSTIEKIDATMLLGYSLGEAINEVYNKKVLDFMKFIDELRCDFEEAPITDYIDILVKKLNLEEYYKAEPERLENIMELKSVLQEADEEFEGTNLEKLYQKLEYLSLRTDKEEKLETDDYVSLMTYHQAKGLEFKVVLMVALEEGIFPGSLAFQSEAEMEEERRIAYVGITRAKEKLFLSYAKRRIIYGEDRFARLSRFIREIDKKYIIVLNNSYKQAPVNKTPYIRTSEPKVQEKKYGKEDYSHDTYNLGDKVNHKVFGDGVIVGINGDTLTIAFKVGIKQITKNHPTLSIIEK